MLTERGLGQAETQVKIFCLLTNNRLVCGSLTLKSLQLKHKRVLGSGRVRDQGFGIRGSGSGTFFIYLYFFLF